MKRRDFIKLTSFIFGSAPFATGICGSLLTTSSAAAAEDDISKSILDENDQAAKNQEYCRDVNAAKPKHASCSAAKAGQKICAKCPLYGLGGRKVTFQGKGYGTCPIFPGSFVSENATCKSFPNA